MGQQVQAVFAVPKKYRPRAFAPPPPPMWGPASCMVKLKSFGITFDDFCTLKTFERHFHCGTIYKELEKSNLIIFLLE